MNSPSLTRELSREVDRRAVEQYGMSSLVLMENAGRGVVDKLFQFGIHGPVVVCCGKGNNGGDGLVIARHLDLRYATVKVLLLVDPGELTGDARTNFEILQHSDVPIEVLSGELTAAQFDALLPRGGWVVDALLGTGARGEPRSPFDMVIERLNSCGARRLAVDLPSGLDCDTGQAAVNTFQAEHTCTFVAPKRGFEHPDAARYTGVVHVLDIGAPRCLVEAVLAQE